MSEELTTYVPKEVLERGKRELERILWQRDEIAKDLEKALNICRSYQRILVMLDANDPNWVEVNQLLIRYKMPHEKQSGGGKIFAEGVDITDHPDSIEGSVTEIEELPSATEDTRYIIEDDDGDPC